MANMVTVGSAVAFLSLDTSRYTASLESAQRNMQQFGNVANSFETRMTGLGSALTGIGKTLTMGVTAPLVAMGAMAVKTAVDLEEAFIGVEKTVDVSGSVEEVTARFAEMRSEIDALAGEIPIAVGELYAIGEIGGTLGVAEESIVSFTETIAKVGIASNMTVDQAASEFARFANIVGMPIDNVDRLAATVVDLGEYYCPVVWKQAA